MALAIHTLNLGGAEGQLVELLRTLDRSRFAPSLVTFRAEGANLGPLTSLGIRPVGFELPPSLLRPAVVRTVVRLAGFCRRERIDVLHAQDFYTNLVAVPAARLAGVPCLVSRLDLCHWYGGLKRQAVAAVSRAANRVWVNAEAVRRLVVREDGVHPQNVELIRNGIDLARFDDAARRPSPDALELTGGGLGPCIIHVANMNHEVKGQEDLLVAVARVARERPGLRLLLVGDGPLRPRWERRAAELGLAVQTRFAGRRTDVPSLLARATVAVSASHAEGLSNAVIEAMAAGLPVVATAVGGNGELVRNGVDGWLVPPRFPSVLADRLAAVLREPGRAAEMGRNGRARVAAMLPLERMVGAFEALYERLARERGTPVEEARQPAKAAPAFFAASPRA
ncbi:MAG TPA: glycosyltransferase [Myxococcales bacterium]|nr:glycosyltransferase [Myxococcales bacterium]